MAYEATPARAGAIAAARDSEAFRAALRVLVSTRVAVLLVAIFAALSFGPASGGLARENAAKFDDPTLTHALGRAAASLRSPAGTPSGTCESPTRATASSAPRAAFFPLYPLLVRALATPFGGLGAAHCSWRLTPYRSRAFLAALVLLYRLTELELGRRLARPTLLLLAVFPAALLLRRALLGEPLPAAGGGRLLRGAYRAAGPGRGRAPGSRPPRAAPACCS